MTLKKRLCPTLTAEYFSVFTHSVYIYGLHSRNSVKNRSYNFLSISYVQFSDSQFPKSPIMPFTRSKLRYWTHKSHPTLYVHINQFAHMKKKISTNRDKMADPPVAISTKKNDFDGRHFRFGVITKPTRVSFDPSTVYSDRHQFKVLLRIGHKGFFSLCGFHSLFLFRFY